MRIHAFIQYIERFQVFVVNVLTLSLLVFIQLLFNKKVFTVIYASQATVCRLPNLKSICSLSLLPISCFDCGLFWHLFGQPTLIIYRESRAILRGFPSFDLPSDCRFARNPCNDLNLGTLFLPLPNQACRRGELGDCLCDFKPRAID